MEEKKIRHSSFNIVVQILITGATLLIGIPTLFSIYLSGMLETIYFIPILLFLIFSGYALYQFYNAKLNFKEEGILSKLFIDSSFLDIKDMKGIWIVDEWSNESKEYTPHTDPEEMESKLILIGDVNY